MMPRRTLAKASHCLFSGGLEGWTEARLLTLEQPALQGGAGLGEAEQALAAIRSAGGLGDVAAVHQVGQHAGERLLGDAQDDQQVGHGDAGVAADEVHRAVMGAAEAELVEDHVGGIGEVAVGEEQQVLSRANGFVGRGGVLRVGSGVRFGHGRHS